MAGQAVFFGLDLAWSVGNATGGAALDENGRLVDERMLGSDDDIMAWVADLLAPGRAVVAVDAPLLVPNETGRRPCESELHRLYGSRKAGPHSSNRSLFEKTHSGVRGEVLASRLEELGFEDPWSGGDKTLLEVYPHPALVEVFSLPERLIYKQKRGVGVPERRRGLKRLDRMLALLSDADPPLHAESMEVPPDARGRELKEIEDRLDARFSAWIAAVWARHGRDRVRLFGDPETGHIAVPIGSFVDARAVAATSEESSRPELETASAIDPIYLPFPESELATHMPPTPSDDSGRVRAWLRHYTDSADRYHRFLEEHPDRRGIPITKARRACQIEKNERFWVAACLMSLVRAEEREDRLADVLRRVYPDGPPGGLGSWNEAVTGDLHLFFEAQLPSPGSYKKWLADHLDQRIDIPYVQHAAHRSGTGDVRGDLEGATHVDALLINADNGFAVVIEAKALSDISVHVSFDSLRNQIARNLDVMLESNSSMPWPLSARDPDRTLFMLLTPAAFRKNPTSRLYGWLMRDYQLDPSAVARDLPHRVEDTLADLPHRIGWATYEDCEEVLPGACPWLTP